MTYLILLDASLTFADFVYITDFCEMPVLTFNSIYVSHSTNESAWFVILMLYCNYHSDNKNITFQTAYAAWIK